MSSVNSISFISSLPIWVHFILFCCLIAVARTFNTMLKKVLRVDILVLHITLGGKLCFSPLRMMFSGDFSYMAFLCWVMFFLYLLYWGAFIINGCFTLSNAFFFESSEMIIWFLFFLLLMYHVDWFTNIEPPLHTGIHPIPLDHCEWFFKCFIRFCLLVFCWGLLHLWSSKVLACSSLYSWCLFLALWSG